MPDKEKFLIVVSILEGQKFPNRPQHKLIAETKFDGELLATDFVDHVETPVFTQELAWQLDKKALQQHRLHRSSFKVQVYAYNIISTMKEMVGYVVLDMRAVQNKLTSKWYPLLHCKYSKPKPEIKLGIYLDEDKTDPNTGKCFNMTAHQMPPHGFQPILNESEGFYQIGLPDACNEMFILSVTVAYAANLTQLVPSSFPLPINSSGYNFYYSLLGNDVTSDNFQDLLNPNFSPERASVKIKSSLDILQSFLSNQPGIQINLCCGDQSLGSCEVPLNTLLKKNSTEIYMQPVTLDGAFQLIPPNRIKQKLAPFPADLEPVVGISVALKKEELKRPTPASDDVHLGEVPVQDKPASQTGQKPEERDVPKNMCSLPQDFIHLDVLEDDKTGGSISSLHEFNAEKKAAIAAVNQNQDRSQFQPDQDTVSGKGRSESTGVTTQNHIAIPQQTHHFTFAVDLKSVRCVENTNIINIFLRYVYPFFGSAAPILTHPPVEIRKGMEVLLPQSFCAFDFACTVEQLHDTFYRVPLYVELWNRDRQLSKDILLGVAKVPLSYILSAEKIRAVNDSGGSGWRRLYSSKMPVYKTDGQQSHKLAEVTVVLSLEDWGPISQHEIIFSSSHQQSQPPIEADKGEGDANFNAKPTELRDSEEYKAVLELEMWKEIQEQEFESQLKQKETMYMKALAEEWKERDKEREVLLKKKLTEYTRLEEQLRSALADLEKRERELLAKEREVFRIKNEQQREHDRKLLELKEASSRLRDDCEHQVQLERTKARELEGIISKYKQELLDAGKKYQALDKEFAIYKEQQNGKPEVRLQSEINLLTLEKVELERKLDSVTKSKIHYKQQWGRALKELARLKQREQAAARAQLKQQEQELEHMRLRYLAAEEKQVVKSEKKELEDIKNELNRLRQTEEEQRKQNAQSGTVEILPNQFASPNSSLDDHISRLIEERDLLLHTGVYTSRDRIIADLDQQIKDAIAQKKS